MSAGNVRNDFLLLPMDSPKMSSHYRPITLMALSVQNLNAQCMMKVGLLPIGNLNKKKSSNMIIMATPQTNSNIKKGNNYTQYQQKQFHLYRPIDDYNIVTNMHQWESWKLCLLLSEGIAQ